LAHDEQARKQSCNRDADRCDDIQRSQSECPALIEQGRIKREGGEGCEAAENASGQEQSPHLARIGLEGEIARQQAHDERADDIDCEGAVG
jgi:hypothetical protein